MFEETGLLIGPLICLLLLPFQTFTSTFLEFILLVFLTSKQDVELIKFQPFFSSIQALKTINFHVSTALVKDM
jgi:hypothetical protein